MNKSEWLDVGLRLFGVWLFIMGIERLFEVVDIRMRFFAPENSHVQSYMWQSVAYFILGTLLFRYANRLVALAYPHKLGKSKES